MSYKNRILDAESLPDRHEKIQGSHTFKNSDGVIFSISARTRKARMSSGEMAKTHIQQMSRGKVPTADSFYKDETEIHLEIQGHSAQEIQINPNGSNSIGNRFKRNLSVLVEDTIASLQKTVM